MRHGELLTVVLRHTVVKPLVGPVVAAVLCAIAACSGEATSPQSDSEPGSSASPAGAAPQATYFPSHRPIAAGPGEMRLDLSTHCGVKTAEVEGVFWVADPPLGDGNPPEGWGYLYTPGRWKPTSETTAVFLADSGVSATFVRSTPDPTRPGCA